MKYKWIVTPEDIKLVQKICKQQSQHKIFIERRIANLSRQKKYVNKERLWRAIFTCLLTTQQRSQENSRINRFLKNGFDPITLSKLDGQKRISTIIRSELKTAGIRRNNLIPKEAKTIYSYLNKTNWKLLRQINRLIKKRGNRLAERDLCNKIVTTKEYLGLGPKQSRNLLQMLGASVYEIPIDSRITKWLNENKIFPFKVGSKGLSDPDIYDFISDAIISVCQRAKVYPCLFDAAVFSFMDKSKTIEK